MSIEETSVKLFGEPAAETPVETAPTQTPAPEPVETQVAPPAPVQTAPPPVPISALLDEREKRQAAERRAAQLEARWQEQERQRQEQLAEIPNVLEDPDGFYAAIDRKINGTRQELQTDFDRKLTKERLETSEEKWRDKLGDDKFEAFHAWTATQPQLNDHAIKQRDPFGVAYKEYERVEKARKAEELLGKLGDKDLDTFLAEQREQWLAENAPTLEAPLGSERARTPDGKFAPTSEQPQRRQAPSLNAVNGASAPRGADARGGYDALFTK